MGWLSSAISTTPMLDEKTHRGQEGELPVSLSRGCPILGTAEPHASVPAAKAYGDDDHVPIGRVLDCVNRL
jgi:hypothetical protein